MVLNQYKYTLVGLQINNLFVQEDVGIKIHGKKPRQFYNCICICGKNIVVRQDAILKQKSCGCLKKGRRISKRKPEIRKEDYKINDKGCWIWQGHIAQHGYGVLYLSTKQKRGNYYAHRISYEFFNGPLDDNRVVDHMCCVKSCVNPKHLRLATHRENTFENTRTPTVAYLNSLKTKCPRGHEYTKSTTRPARVCLICMSNSAKERWKRLKKLRTSS